MGILSSPCFFSQTSQENPNAANHYLHNCIVVGMCLLCQRSCSNPDLLRQPHRLAQRCTIVQRRTRRSLCRRCYSASRSDWILHLQLFQHRAGHLRQTQPELLVESRGQWPEGPQNQNTQLSPGGRHGSRIYDLGRTNTSSRVATCRCGTGKTPIR